MAPASCIPLIPRTGCDQGLLPLPSLRSREGTATLAIVRVGLAVGDQVQATHYQHASAVVETDPVAMAERLEHLFTDALPQARSVALRAGNVRYGSVATGRSVRRIPDGVSGSRRPSQ
jgi:hypothetical protein